MMRGILMAMAGLGALTGCAAAAQTDPLTVAPPASRAEVLAAALAQAASAEQSGDQAAMARAVAIIDRIGARPLEGESSDPVTLWRANASLQDKPPMRGRPLGPGYRSGRIRGGGTESFAQLFLSGTGASIAVSAPNGGRVAMRVIDPQAKTVCKGEANRGGTCRWVPLFTQRYTIEVANLGNEDVRYFLVVE